MPAIAVNPPFPLFTDADGQPLDDAYIYIGTANQNPVSNPIAVYWDPALTIAAAQPIRTSGGYPVYNGTPARFYTNSDYSILVRDKNGAFIYTAASETDFISSEFVTFIQSGTGAVNRTVQAKLRETVSVKDFGAVGDGVTDDTAAIQAAIDTVNNVHFPPGTYKVTVSNISPFTYGNTTDPVYRAININKSNLRITGDCAVINLFGYDNPSGGEVNYAFSTAKNMTLGAISNIEIRGLEFEFNPAGKSGTTYRSLHIVGCRGVVLDDLFLYSSGSRFGATITLQNCEQVRFSNIRMRNVTQGMNFSYVDDVQFSNIMLDYFSEGIDFDRMVSRCTATNVNFTSTYGIASGQCWDMNSVRDSTFKNITAYNCGNVAYLNFKQTTPPTYAEYINNDPVTVFTPSRNVTIDGAKVHTCAQGGAAFYVGDDANTNPGVLTSDITITNVDMMDSGGFEVRMAIDVTLENITCINAYPNLTANFALFFILQGSRTNARSSAKLRNITVKGVATSQDVIRISGAEACLMDRLHIENFPLDAVEISSPGIGSHYSICNSKFLRTIDTTPTGTAVRITSVTTEKVQFEWANNIITQYTTPIVISNNTAGRMLPRRTISLGQQVYTSGTKRVELYCDKNKTAYFGDVLLTALTAASDGTNYINYIVRNTGTSVCSGSDTAGITSGTPFAIGFAAPEALAEVDPAEVMYLEATAVGTGRTLDAFSVHAYMLEYLKV